MKNFFTDYFQDVIENWLPSRPPLDIYGEYDNKFDEYVISIPDIRWKDNHLWKSLEGFTVGFNEPSKRWNSFYSYQGPLASYNSILHSFNSGNIFQHNYLETPGGAPMYNQFYGIDYSSIIVFPFNSYPDTTKVFHSITEDASDIWESILVTRNGQITNINRIEFTNGATSSWEDGHGTKENKHNSLIRCDLFTPIVTNPKIEGDRMRDTSIMSICTLQTPQAQEQNVLFSVNCGFITSINPTINKNQ